MHQSKNGNLRPAIESDAPQKSYPAAHVKLAMGQNEAALIQILLLSRQHDGAPKRQAHLPAVRVAAENQIGLMLQKMFCAIGIVREADLRFAGRNSGESDLRRESRGVE